VGPLILTEPACAPIDGPYMDDRANALTGAWHDGSADESAYPGDGATQQARPDDVEFADVVNSANGLAEARSDGCRKAAPGDFAEQAVQAGNGVGVAGVAAGAVLVTVTVAWIGRQPPRVYWRQRCCYRGCQFRPPTRDNVLCYVGHGAFLPCSLADHLRDLLSQAHHLQQRFARQALDGVVPGSQVLEEFHLRDNPLADLGRCFGVFLQGRGALAQEGQGRVDLATLTPLHDDPDDFPRVVGREEKV